MNAPKHAGQTQATKETEARYSLCSAWHRKMCIMYASSRELHGK